MSSQRAAQLVEAGVWLRASGDFAGARRLFEQALQLDPGNVRARGLLEAAGPAMPAATNPFQRPAPDPPGAPLVALETDWGAAAEPAAGRPPETDAIFSADFEPVAEAPEELDVELEVEPGQSALDLLDPPPPPRPASEGSEEVRALLSGAKDLLQLDDHGGAMELLLKAQAIAPDDPEVRGLREQSERVLLGWFESKLGDLGRAPRVKLKEDEIIWLNLDHRAGFVLAQIDGSVTFEDVFSLSGMSRLDTARILAQLVEEGVIGS